MQQPGSSTEAPPWSRDAEVSLSVILNGLNGDFRGERCCHGDSSVLEKNSLATSGSWGASGRGGRGTRTWFLSGLSLTLLGHPHLCLMLRG